MKYQASTIPSLRFTLSLSALGDRELPSRIDRPATKVSLKISTLPSGRTVRASPQSFLALVHIDAKSPNSIRVILPDGSQKEVLQRAGELCLLPPRTTVTNRNGANGELIQYQIPRASLRAFAQRSSHLACRSLKVPSVAPDATLTILSRAVRPMLFEKQPCPADVAEYFTLSVYSHLLDRYGEDASSDGHFTGGFSPQHKRMISEALEEALGQHPSMEELAQQCGLSVGHFARAFRQTFGSSFHKYLLEARVARAQEMLVRSPASLTQIAVEIGYADQPTFTESFTRVVGMPPGRYRRRFSLQSSAPGTSETNSLAAQSAST
jgi:AraC-like DNA-binding protein